MLLREIEISRKMIVDSKEIRKEYQDWLSNPMTARVLDIMTMEGQPQLMDRIDQASAAHVLGHAAGWVNAIRRMQTLDQKPAPEPESKFEEQ